MKKTILYLFLLISTALFSQFQPTYPPLMACENTNGGFAVFNLTAQVPLILGNQSPNTYSVSFFETMVDATTNANPIVNASSYVNITPYSQTIYIGIVNINTNAISTATMSLIVNLRPVYQPLTLVSCYVQGLADFDLGTVAEGIWANNGNASNDIAISFHLSQTDAVNQQFPQEYYYLTDAPVTDMFINITNTQTGCTTIGVLVLIAENCGGNPCAAPQNLTASATTTTTSNLSWAPTDNGLGYDYIVLPSGAAAPNATSSGFVSTTSPQAQITQLTANTCYTFYVRTYCTITQKSAWSLGNNFCTAATAIYCGNTFVDNGGPNEDYSLYSDSYTTVCPSTAGDVVTVTFTSFDTEAQWDGLYVFNGNSINATQIASANGPGNGSLATLAGAFWGTAIPGPFTSSSPDGCLTFRFISDGSVVRPGWVANITCAPPATCLPITQVASTAITPTSATLSWSNPNSATNFEVLATPQGSPVPLASATGFTVTTVNPFVLVGLSPNTCYTVYVRTRCASDDAGAWSAGHTFCTLIAPPACGGNFVDNGGLTADYNNNSNSTTTICPTLPQQLVTVSFSAFNTEENWDALYVYDGATVTSPQIASQNGPANVPGGVAGGYWGTEIPGPFTSSSPDGCLTFVFRSDTSVSRPGWVANVTCDIVDRVILHAFLDSNNNGIKDNNETSFNHGSFMVDTNNSGSSTEIFSPEGYHVITDSNGTASFDINYQVQSEYGPYFSAGSIGYNNITIPIGGGTQTLYFPIAITQAYSDVAVTIIPINAPRAGITNYKNEVVVTNLGTQTIASTTVNFVKDSALGIANVSDTGATITPTGFTRVFTNLLPNESRSVVVNMIVPAIPTVSIGQILTNSATVSPPSNDIIASNNVASMSQPIIAAYDPNDKMESHGGRIQFDTFAQDDFLFYTIRFENTGTINAIDVKITDLLDSRIDEASVRMLATSHPYLLTRTGSYLVWDFVDIQLPVSIPNTLLGKGFITFKVKLKPGFAVGDIIPNEANIFFDTNPAITTNSFNTVFTPTLGTSTFINSDVVIYPNPATTMVQIALNNSSETINSVVVYDLMGKNVMLINDLNSSQFTLNTSTLSKGIYMLEINSNTDAKLVKKLVIK